MCENDNSPLEMEEQGNNKTGGVDKVEINGSSASRSPFELRRHQSYNGHSTESSERTRGKLSRSSMKYTAGGAVGNKVKPGNQILSFFRSQSHEPKGDIAAALTSNGDAVTEPGVDPIPSGNKRLGRKRPQSLHTKTTSSKGVFVHRVSGIETTPETPEEKPVDQVDGDLDSNSNSNGSVEEVRDEGRFRGDDRNNRGIVQASSGGNSSSRSSVTSSDSYASCELGTVIRSANQAEGDDLMRGTMVEVEEEESKDDRQSLKHLSVSAPAMRTPSTKSGEGSDSGLPPQTSSKSRQKKFHRHFKTVPPDEKVLDYYSCALVADILLQGFLYITENYFAFYSNVFGYVTKVLIPVCSVVRITKERTAKIFPNAVGVCTRTEKHVFASLISRDTTFKLMCKVWNYSIEQEAEEIRALQRRVAAQVQAEDAFSADVVVPDESSGDSGSGNDSAIEPSSHSPSPQNTPGIEKLIHAKCSVAAIPSHLATAGVVAGVQSVEEKSMTLVAGGKLSDDPNAVPILNYRGANSQFRTSIPTASNNPNLHAATNAHHLRASKRTSSRFSAVRQLGVGGRGPSLLLLATALLVILFVSAALLLTRISNLQQKLMERPVIHDSEQFYQELLSWQTKLHSTTGDEIHQYINSNLQQIVKVRESLEALSMLFVNRPQGNAGLGEPHPSTIMTGEADHHHHHHQDS